MYRKTEETKLIVNPLYRNPLALPYPLRKASNGVTASQKRSMTDRLKNSIAVAQALLTCCSVLRSTSLLVAPHFRATCPPASWLPPAPCHIPPSNYHPFLAGPKSLLQCQGSRCCKPSSTRFFISFYFYFFFYFVTYLFFSLSYFFFFFVFALHFLVWR